MNKKTLCDSTVYLLHIVPKLITFVHNSANIELIVNCAFVLHKSTMQTLPHSSWLNKHIIIWVDITACRYLNLKRYDNEVYAKEVISENNDQNLMIHSMKILNYSQNEVLYYWLCCCWMVKSLQMHNLNELIFVLIINCSH